MTVATRASIGWGRHLHPVSRHERRRKQGRTALEADPRLRRTRPSPPLPIPSRASAEEGRGALEKAPKEGAVTRSLVLAVAAVVNLWVLLLLVDPLLRFSFDLCQPSRLRPGNYRNTVCTTIQQSKWLISLPVDKQRSERRASMSQSWLAGSRWTIVMSQNAGFTVQVCVFFILSNHCTLLNCWFQIVKQRDMCLKLLWLESVVSVLS